MDDLVAHADDVGPRDLGVLVRELSRHLSPSSTDDLNEMNQREAKILATSETLSSRGRVLTYPVRLKALIDSLAARPA